MSISKSIGITGTTFIADEDLTAWQYRFVTVASAVNTVKKATGASNPAPLGVLQNSPSLGQEAHVVILGPTKLVGLCTSTCYVTWGKFLSASNGGQAVPNDTGTGSVVVARWLDANITTTGGSAIGSAFVFGIGYGSCAISAS